MLMFVKIVKYDTHPAAEFYDSNPGLSTGHTFRLDLPNLMVRIKNRRKYGRPASEADNQAIGPLSDAWVDYYMR